MYEMSSEAERLTQIGKITVEQYSDHRAYTVRLNKKGGNDLYAI